MREANPPGMRRFVPFVLALLLCAQPLALLRSAGAADDQSYAIPVWFRWDTTELDVLIVPPNHGQLFNGNGALNGADPKELTPFNSYLKAMEDSIADWDHAVGMFGADWLKSSFVTNVYVLGRDVPPSSALSDPEIVIMTDETKANTLGISFSTDPCISDNSKLFVTSFTYEDMYNVNAHEYGHCLGLDHVVNGNPAHDTMAATYVDPVGSAGNHLHCVSSLDVKGLEAALGAAAGQPSPDAASIPAVDYATTCGTSQPDESPPPVGSPSPAPETPSPQSSASPSPEASPSPTPSPEPTPTPAETPEPATPAPTPSPTPEPTSEPEDGKHGRTVGLRLRRHLVATGRVTAKDGFTDCEIAAEVRISMRTQSGWVDIALTSTGSSGRFRVTLEDERGRYRARVSKTSTGGHDCLGAESVTRRHRH